MTFKHLSFLKYQFSQLSEYLYSPYRSSLLFKVLSKSNHTKHILWPQYFEIRNQLQKASFKQQFTIYFILILKHFNGM